MLAIEDELTEHGFVLRYKTDETDDGLSGKEGTFLICSFWLVSALAVIGELQRARDLMERLLRIASPLGLYAEEFDADTARHLGNFPQAFSHLALIQAAARIIVAERLEEMTRMSDYDVIVDRQRRGRRDARAPARHDRQADPAARARRLAAARARELVGAATSSSTTATCRPTRGTTATAQPFQPQVHYFVGGATKLYGAALYRLRAEDFGELAPPRRRLARVADRLRRDGAVLHRGRADVPRARRARRGPDRAAGERAVPVPGARARAADPAALGRPRGGRLPAVPRAVRRHARRREPAVQHLRALRDVRRLPVPRARQVRRRGARRAARARVPERHAAHRRPGRAGSRPTQRARRSRAWSPSTTAAPRRSAATSSSSRAARPTRPPCCSRRPPTATPTASPTGPGRSGATTCSTTARPSWPCRRKRTRRSSRRRSG